MQPALFAQRIITRFTLLKNDNCEYLFWNTDRDRELQKYAVLEVVKVLEETNTDDNKTKEYFDEVVKYINNWSK